MPWPCTFVQASLIVYSLYALVVYKQWLLPTQTVEIARVATTSVQQLKESIILQTFLAFSVICAVEIDYEPMQNP